MAQEIELKLDLTLEAAAFLEASTVLTGAVTKARQHALYFDTPGRDLTDNGLSLRIRRTGRKRVQTIKANGGSSAGLFDRAEWEIPVTSDIPVADDRAPLRALLGKRISDIAPIFTVEIERRTWNLTEGDSRIEFVLDRGMAKVGERQTPISEVELELKSGDPDALFALARKIDAVVPVRLGVLSKSDRGYRLLEPAQPSFKAGPVRLDAQLSTAEAFQQIARLCLHHYRLNEAIVIESRGAEALHQSRVAIRRLRSALSIFKAILIDDQFERFREGFRELATSLGRARDVDVLLARTTRGALRERLQRSRDAVYADVEHFLASEQTRRLILDLLQWVNTGHWLQTVSRRDALDEPAIMFADTTLDRFRKKVKKQGKGLPHLTDEERHEVRKRVKKLRYASEFFAALFPSGKQERQHRKFVARLAKLQDKLGILNDRASAREVLDHLGLANEPDAVDLLGGAKASKLIQSAAGAYADLIDAPKFWG